MPPRTRAAFLFGVFLIFLPSGILASDIPSLGADTPARMLGHALLGGGMAVLWMLALQRWRVWLPIVIVVQVIASVEFNRLFGAPGTALAGAALQARLGADVSWASLSIGMGFGCLSFVIRREGARSGQLRAEIALAREIHQHLVPRIDRQIGSFEFRGASLPSGDVGGDLIDLVETPDGWTGFIADVSGHGVGAGLLMGMVKSAARSELRAGHEFDALLGTVNAVIFDLKSPAMFATFAGLQYTAGSGLRFAVAGHIPILHYHAASSSVEELSIAQLPLAMFDDTRFTSSPVLVAPGDLFVILTDGLTEVFDRQDREFGLDRVTSLVQAHAAAPLEVLEENLLAAARAHGPQLDDQTFLFIRARASL